MSKANMDKIASVIQKYSKLRGIPYDVLYNQIEAESSGNPKALGDSGKSRGLMQIHENTAKGSLKMTDKDLPRLFEPDYNVDKGTEYLLMIKKYLGTLLPADPKESWAMVVMSYNSGMGYMQKALQRLKDKKVFQPTLAMAIQEMQTTGFGKTPIFSITVPYATRIVTGVTSFVSKPAVQITSWVVLGVALVAGYFLIQKRRG
jgi:soluble lytic murein transglycosylase-like protein